MVVSVIMYNCSSWAAKDCILEKLDICHRKHLRQILKIRYPTTITNKKLYEVTSTTALSERVKVARWKMFGHILRSPQNSPAALSLAFAVHGSSSLKGRRGNHQTNLLKTIRKDISRVHFSANEHLTRPIKLTKEDDITIVTNVLSLFANFSCLTMCTSKCCPT